MIFTTREGKIIDTDKDLTPPERHVIQKLFLWETLATSIEQFREKTQHALKMGWNNSGPIKETSTLKLIINELEKRVMERLKK